MRVWCGMSRLILVASALATVACGGARPEVKVALTGTLPELQREIAKAEQSGALSDARLKDLARAVAEREIAGARGPEGAQQVALFRPCSGQVEAALDERAAR